MAMDMDINSAHDVSNTSNDHVMVDAAATNHTKNRQQSNGSFPCSICSRSYSRIDHLSRHFRSHTAEKPYTCTVCNKSFSRPDLLKRHAQGHLDSGSSNLTHDGQNLVRPQRNGRVSQACAACAVAKLKCKEEKPCQRCQRKGIACVYNESGNSQIRSSSNSTSNRTFESDHSQTAQRFSDSSLYDPKNIVAPFGASNIELAALAEEQDRARSNSSHNSNTPIADMADGVGTVNRDAGYHSFMPHRSDEDSMVLFPPIDNSLADFLKDIMGSTATEPYNTEAISAHGNGTATPYGGYRNLFDFGLEENMELNDSDYDVMQYFQGKAVIQMPPLPMAEAALDLETTFVPPISSSIQTDDPPQSRALTGVGLGIEAFRKSLWCWAPTWDEKSPSQHLDFALPREDVASPQSHFQTHVQVITETLGTEARDQVLAMLLRNCPRSEFSKVVSSFPTAEFLEILMHSFLGSHLAHSDTWVHLPTFRISEQRPEVIGGCIAAGALLSTSPSIRKFGFAIQESIRISFQATFEQDNSLTNNLGLLQAFALNLDAGLWSGNKRRIELAESLSQVLITMFRRRGRFLRSGYPLIVPLPSDEGEILSMKWREWVLQESFKRLVFHLFIRDAQSSMSLLINMGISYAELTLPFPACRTLWLAKNAITWKEIFLSKRPQSLDRVPALPQCLYNVSPLIAFKDFIDLDLSTVIVCYGLSGLIQEFSRMSSITRAYPPPELHSGVLIQNHRHQELLQLLLRFGVNAKTYNGTAGTSPSPRMLMDLLLMHLHVSFDDLQLFAGREGEEDARRVYPSLTQWITRREARQAVWYAGQIIRSAKLLYSHQLRDFTAIAVYHASLVFWVYGMLSVTSGMEATDGHMANAQELVCLDGEDSHEVQQFVEFQRGIPCFSKSTIDEGVEGQPSNLTKLSNSDEVMANISQILRGKPARAAQGESQVPPLSPLSENLSQLMKELGAASRYILCNLSN